MHFFFLRNYMHFFFDKHEQEIFMQRPTTIAWSKRKLKSQNPKK
jgi:hypothetical protein